jgi:uncharacterized membrane protein YagU involved in acid resistance
MTSSTWTPNSTTLRNAVLASLTGTAAFGVLMSAMGMMPMLGMLVGVADAGVGWAVHLALGALFGLALAVIVNRWHQWPRTFVGLAFGLVLWILGPLIIMPLWLSVTADPAMRGMVFNLGVAAPWWSLAGHAIYGLIAGLILQVLQPTDDARGTTARRVGATGSPKSNS